MSYKVKKLQDDEKGTHYGIFTDELLIHYVFSRGRALEIVEKLQKGAVLVEVISIDIRREEQRKFKKLLDAEQQKSSVLDIKLIEANKKISKLTSIASVNEQSISVPTKLTSLGGKELLFMSRHKMNQIEASELVALISEVKAKGFEYSKELSNYIIKNQLKNKYRNISGVVKMEKSGEQWDFSGGFPKKIYSIVCSELGLSDQGTTAKAVGFKSFKDMGELF
ncbi:hypothetical protein [Photobacterium leiognathi]|uniref:hypothetical protein n=1 Tax=Photobacterium leiognathi TaxID=553611 RepID=UPI0029823252|nr:hypothetical protein [Photobacterium leiognathi]